MVPSDVVKQEAGVELESGEAIDDGEAIDGDLGDFLRSINYPLLQIAEITQILHIRSVTITIKLKIGRSKSNLEVGYFSTFEKCYVWAPKPKLILRSTTP